MLYPVMTKSRMLFDLSGIWAFRMEDEEGQGEREGWAGKPLPQPMTMAVPASYNDMKACAKLRDYHGVVYYQTTVRLARTMLEERLVLRCGAVTHHAKVYLNGSLVMAHRGGFLPFEAEVSGFAKEGDNLLTIAVDNRIDHSTLPVGEQKVTPAGEKVNATNFDFFNYAGINRPVKLYTTPQDFIADLTVTADVDFESGSAVLHYAITALGEGEGRIAVYDEAGSLVGQGEGKTGDVTIEKVRLWQPMDAYLYEVRAYFGMDEYILPYGIRTVRVDGTRFLINERPFYFKGYGKHEDTYPNGRGFNEAMNVKDLALLKWQGANSFRTSHYPYSEEMMRLCDREGIVVIDECPAVGLNLRMGGGFFGATPGATFDPETGIKTGEHHQDVLRELAARDKNFACVVMWSIANEPDSNGEGAWEYFAPLFALMRELDPQHRPCTLVNCQMLTDAEMEVSLKLADVICLNRYYGWYYCSGDLESAEKELRAELEKWAAYGKPIVFTEFGADTVAGLHDATPVMFTEEFQVDYYEMNTRVFDDFPAVQGEQVWNFADFATSQGVVRVQGNKKGLFTRDRKPKMAAHFMRRRWLAIPDFDYKK